MTASSRRRGSWHECWILDLLSGKEPGKPANQRHRVVHCLWGLNWENVSTEGHRDARARGGCGARGEKHTEGVHCPCPCPARALFRSSGPVCVRFSAGFLPVPLVPRMDARECFGVLLGSLVRKPNSLYSSGGLPCRSSWAGQKYGCGACSRSVCLLGTETVFTS